MSAARPERDGDGEDGDHDRQQARHERAEHDHEHDEGDDDADRLALAQVLVDDLRDLLVEADLTERPHGHAVAACDLDELIEVLAVVFDLTLVRERELHEHGVAVVGDEPIVVERTHRGDDAMLRAPPRAPR